MCVAPFDGKGGWYASIDNLKTLRTLGWPWLTRLPANRNVNFDRQGLKAVRDTAIDAAGTVVHLEKYGLLRVFKIVSGRRHCILGDKRPGHDRPETAGPGRPLVDDRELPPRPEAMLRCPSARKSARRKRERNHIGLAIRAFLRLEHHFYTTGVSWYEAKTRIIRDAIRTYLAGPLYKLPLTA